MITSICLGVTMLPYFRGLLRYRNLSTDMRKRVRINIEYRMAFEMPLILQTPHLTELLSPMMNSPVIPDMMPRGVLIMQTRKFVMAKLSISMMNGCV